MTTYTTRPINTQQHPADVLSDVLAAANEAARNYGLPLSFGLSSDPLIIREGEPTPPPVIRFVCHLDLEADLNEELPTRTCNAGDGACESCS